MKIIIDDQPIQCKEGDLLIDVMLNNQINIPHFCYHKDLGIDGNCRMCMVEIKGAKRPQIACDTFVKEDLEVSTVSKKITEVKRSILELELLNHPVDCPICDQAGECKLQDYYMDYGLYDSRQTTEKTKKGKNIDLGSNVVLDQERCVLCTRCVRFTAQITKTGELGILGRGDRARIAVAPDFPLNNPYAMNVVELCPVGALTSKDFRFKQRVWFLDSTKSICHGCSRGCNIDIDYNETKYGSEKVHRFRSRRNKTINKSFLCDYGRLSYKELNDVCDKKSSSIQELQQAFINNDKKIALASASLSWEQLDSIKSFCQKNDIELFSLPYIDDSFGDDWLKTNDMSANFNSVKKLEISYDEKRFQDVLKDSDLILNFDHKYFKNENKSDKTLVQFTTTSCSENYDLIFPIANFAHDTGHVINCDGIKQKFFSTKFRGEQITLTQLLEELR